MSTQAGNSVDRMRTIWTPEMDRYFVDLMMDQINKGNRTDGHFFTKGAWNQMTELFNAKFSFQYPKEVLKNRHKTLRNLYRAVKNLLEHKGFSWDESRHMVIADNYVWDEYIKVCPDARSFRTKSIPYYNNMCSIYMNATVDQKGEDAMTAASGMGNVCEGSIGSSHEVAISEDYELSITKEAVDRGLSSCNIRLRANWQPPMDRYLIDLMLNQIQKGNRIDGVFRKQAWAEMIASFNAKFNFNYDMDILKNRFKTLRRQHNVIKNLLDLDGFVWDDTRQMVTADDHVWQNYLKTHTDARQFMTRHVPYYKDLCTICGDSSVDEKEGLSGQNIMQPNGNDEEKFQETLQTSQSESSEDQLEDVREVLRAVVSDKKKRHQFEDQLNAARLKKAKDKHEGVANKFCEIVTAVAALSQTSKEDENSKSVSVEKVVEAVQALPDMDEELILDACDFLEDEKKAKIFLALDVKLRKKWLMRKLRPDTQVV